MDQVKTIDLVADGLEQTSVSVSLVLTAIPERLPPGVARDELTKALTEIKANLDEMHRQLVRAGFEIMAAAAGPTPSNPLAVPFQVEEDQEPFPDDNDEAP